MRQPRIMQGRDRITYRRGRRPKDPAPCGAGWGEQRKHYGVDKMFQYCERGCCRRSLNMKESPNTPLSLIHISEPTRPY